MASSKRRKPARPQPRTTRATPWHEDPAKIEELTSRLLGSVSDGAGNARNAKLFPGGITHLKLDLAAGSDGLRFGVDIGGPPVAPAPNTARTADRAKDDKQLTPTASWWFRVGTNDPFMKVVSLGGYALITKQPPAFGWSLHNEHWVIDKTIGATGQPDLKDIIAGNTLDVSIHFYTHGLPSNDLTDEAEVLADADYWRYQGKAKGELSSGDWAPVPTNGPPSGTGLRYYFDEGGEDTKRARILFELASNRKNFARVTWITEATYDAYSGDLTLPAATIPTDWSNLKYYQFVTNY